MIGGTGDHVTVLMLTASRMDRTIYCQELGKN